jgi:hypothetical protein
MSSNLYSSLHYRAVGRSENPGVPVVIRWAKSVPLVEIGWTDLPKSGGAMATPAPPGTTPMIMMHQKKLYGFTMYWALILY